MSEVPQTFASFMYEAITQGDLALPACLPNPPVGCVLVRDGAIIARGFTQPPYQPHAEAMALRQIEGSLEDVTAIRHPRTVRVPSAHTLMRQGDDRSANRDRLRRVDRPPSKEPGTRD
jgi:tRNA(Arg) A34 adenosine deaminase TadA